MSAALLAVCGASTPGLLWTASNRSADESQSQPSHPSRREAEIKQKWGVRFGQVISLDWFKEQSTGNHGFYH